MLGFQATIRRPNISTKAFHHHSSFKTQALNFLLSHRSHIAWQKRWFSFPSNYSRWDRDILHCIVSRLWFSSIIIPRRLISSFSRLRLGHDLPNHSSSFPKLFPIVPLVPVHSHLRPSTYSLSLLFT